MTSEGNEESIVRNSRAEGLACTEFYPTKLGAQSYSLPFYLPGQRPSMHTRALPSSHARFLSGVITLAAATKLDRYRAPVAATFNLGPVAAGQKVKPGELAIPIAFSNMTVLALDFQPLDYHCKRKIRGRSAQGATSTSTLTLCSQTAAVRPRPQWHLLSVYPSSSPKI